MQMHFKTNMPCSCAVTVLGCLKRCLLELIHEKNHLYSLAWQELVVTNCYNLYFTVWRKKVLLKNTVKLIRVMPTGLLPMWRTL